MTHRLAALVLCTWAAGCKPGATTLRLDIDAAAGVAVHSLTLRLALGSDDAGVSEALPPSGAVPTLPGSAVVRLPDVAMTVAVTLDGQDADGAPLHAETTVQTVPHEEVAASLTLGTRADADLGGAADLALPVDEGAPCVAGARCSYASYRRLTIHNGAAAALPVGYTVRVPLDPALFPTAETRADLADVRVFGDVPAGESARVIDPAPPGQVRALWLALAHPIAAGASDSSYSIYYGNAAAATPPSDATQVFPLWDGFDNGAQLAPFWQVSGSPVASGGTLTLHLNTHEALRTDGVTDAVPTLSALEWRALLTDPASAGQVVGGDTFWSWIGYQRSNDFNATDPWVVWIVRGPTDLHGERKIPTAGDACINGCSGPTVSPDNAYHWYRIERAPTTTRFYRDGVLSASIDDPNSSDYAVMLRNYAVTSDLVVDWIRARALATPEPTVTVGPKTAP